MNINKIKPTTRMEGEHSADIKDFFAGGPVRIISDPEGYHVCQLAHEQKRDAVPSNKMLVLGDLMDYTLGGGDNFNNFATEKLTKLREAKSNSFKSVKYCLAHESRVKVLFGNRDLNKLKLLPLGLITNDKGKYDKWWETGTSYLDAAKDLKQKISGDHKWAIPSMKNWKPFWKFNKEKSKYEMPNGTECKIWAEEPRLVDDKATKMSCLERYYLIFGADCMQGTMGGQNNLFGVAQECGDAYNSIFGNYSDFLNNITGDKTNYLLTIANQPENEAFKNDCELAAALVFTVYMDALYGTGEPSDSKPFTGVLHRFFNAKNTYFCAYAVLGSGKTPNLLTFSHGGMRAEFFTKCDLKNDAADYFHESDTLLKEAFTTQQGGHLGTGVETKLSSSEITGKINDYNKSMKAALKKTIDFYHNEVKNNTPTQIDKPTAELLINLVISVPHKYGVGCSHTDAGPINPGIVGYRVKPIVVSDAKLYQFIGHGPMGFAPTIDKYLSSDGKMASYLINLDISNSLFGQFGHLSADNIFNNYSYVEASFNGTTLTAKSNVNVALNGYDIEIMNGKKKETKKITQLEISDHNLLALLSGKDSTEFFKSDKRTNYHGKINIDSMKYDLFTTVLSSSPFTVYLYAIKSYLQGGRSIRRHRKTTSTKQTGKSRVGKFHVRRSHTLVRRKPMMKRTAKKIRLA